LELASSPAVEIVVALDGMGGLVQGVSQAVHGGLMHGRHKTLACLLLAPLAQYLTREIPIHLYH
jgi:hypothetical protein